jgi:uncharacterized HAD superfamily protein
MIYCFDIDGTLCVETRKWWDYKNAEPIPESIEKVKRKFYDDGHTIILYTARFEEDRKVTTDWLVKYKVPFHRLVMDKPFADVYVDNNMKKVEDL